MEEFAVQKESSILEDIHLTGSKQKIIKVVSLCRNGCKNVHP